MWIFRRTYASCCCTGNWAYSLNPSFSISSWRFTDRCWLLFQGPKLSACSHLWNMGCCFVVKSSTPGPFTCNYFEKTQMWIPDTRSTFHSFVVKIVGSLQYCCEVGGNGAEPNVSSLCKSLQLAHWILNISMWKLSGALPCAGSTN